MTGAALAQLIITFGPSAFDLAKELVALWDKELTVEDVVRICSVAQTPYDKYIQDAKVAAGKTV